MIVLTFFAITIAVTIPFRHVCRLPRLLRAVVDLQPRVIFLLRRYLTGDPPKDPQHTFLTISVAPPTFAAHCFRQKPSRPPPPAYTDPPSPDSRDTTTTDATTTTSLLNPAALMVTGEPVLATAVPLDDTDIENNINSNNAGASSSTTGEKKGGGNSTGSDGVDSAGAINDAAGGTGFHEGVSVGPPEGGVGAVGIPVAHAVQMEEGMDGRSGMAAAAGGGGVGGASGGGGGAFPPQRIDDLALPEVRERVGVVGVVGGIIV